MFPMVSVRPKSLEKAGNRSEPRSHGVQEVRKDFSGYSKINTKRWGDERHRRGGPVVPYRRIAWITEVKVRTLQQNASITLMPHAEYGKFV